MEEITVIFNHEEMVNMCRVLTSQTTIQETSTVLSLETMMKIYGILAEDAGEIASFTARDIDENYPQEGPLLGGSGDVGGSPVEAGGPFVLGGAPGEPDMRLVLEGSPGEVATRLQQQIQSDQQSKEFTPQDREQADASKNSESPDLFEASHISFSSEIWNLLARQDIPQDLAKSAVRLGMQLACKTRRNGAKDLYVSTESFTQGHVKNHKNPTARVLSQLLEARQLMLSHKPEKVVPKADRATLRKLSGFLGGSSVGSREELIERCLRALTNEHQMTEELAKSQEGPRHSDHERMLGKR